MSELNTLLEYLPSWVAAIDRPSEDASIDVVHFQELGELESIKYAWEKTRDSLHSALETLTSEPMHHHHPRSSLAFIHRRWRWMTSMFS